MIDKARLARIENTTKSTQLAANARVANSFWSRLVGLLGRRRLPVGEGLVLIPGASIHTFCMMMSIDVVFVDREGQVLKTAANVRPFRVVISPRGARYTLELPVGVIEQTKTQVSDRLDLSPA